MAHGITIVTEQAEQAREQALAAEARTDEVDFFHLFWIYMIVSIVGMYIETIVSFPIDGVWKNRAGLIFGPFSPIYGLGAVFITLALHRVRHARAFTLFVVAALVGATFEYLVGTFWQSMFGFVAWDYSAQPFNIGGKTCLKMALVWGMGGLIWMKFLLPGVIGVIDLIPARIRQPLTNCAMVLMVADAALTIAAFQCWYDRAVGIELNTPVMQLINQAFNDEFMASHFQTISIIPDLARW